MIPEEIAADIQARVDVFMEARGGYVAGASGRELFDLLLSYGDARAAQERERGAQIVGNWFPDGRGMDMDRLAAAIRANAE